MDLLQRWRLEKLWLLLFLFVLEIYKEQERDGGEGEKTYTCECVQGTRETVFFYILTELL